LRHPGEELIQGDPSCDPGCGRNYCCLLKKGLVDANGTPVNATPVPANTSPIIGNR
jgi:hypothetical protein